MKLVIELGASGLRVREGLLGYTGRTVIIIMLPDIRMTTQSGACCTVKRAVQPPLRARAIDFLVTVPRRMRRTVLGIRGNPRRRKPPREARSCF